MHQVTQTDERVVATDRALAGFVRTSRADHSANNGDRVWALENGGHDR